MLRVLNCQAWNTQQVGPWTISLSFGTDRRFDWCIRTNYAPRNIIYTKQKVGMQHRNLANPKTQSTHNIISVDLQSCAAVWQPVQNNLWHFTSRIDISVFRLWNCQFYPLTFLTAKQTWCIMIITSTMILFCCRKPRPQKDNTSCHHVGIVQETEAVIKMLTRTLTSPDLNLKEHLWDEDKPHSSGFFCKACIWRYKGVQRLIFEMFSLFSVEETTYKLRIVVVNLLVTKKSLCVLYSSMQKCKKMLFHYQGDKILPGNLQVWILQFAY